MFVQILAARLGVLGFGGLLEGWGDIVFVCCFVFVCFVLLVGSFLLVRGFVCLLVISLCAVCKVYVLYMTGGLYVFVLFSFCRWLWFGGCCFTRCWMAIGLDFV